MPSTAQLRASSAPRTRRRCRRTAAGQPRRGWPRGAPPGRRGVLVAHQRPVRPAGASGRRRAGTGVPAPAAGAARVGHEGTDEHVADPALVGRRGLVAPERARLGQRAPRGAGRAGAAAGGGCAPRPGRRGGPAGSRDLGRRAGGHLQRAGGPPRPAVPGGGAPRPGRRGWRPEPVQALLAVGPHPAVERCRGCTRASLAVGVQVHSVGDRPHDRASLRRRQAPVGGLGDHPQPVHRDGLLLVLIHVVSLVMSRTSRDRRHETTPADDEIGRIRVGQRSPSRRSPPT